MTCAAARAPLAWTLKETAHETRRYLDPDHSGPRTGRRAGARGGPGRLRPRAVDDVSHSAAGPALRAAHVATHGPATGRRRVVDVLPLDARRRAADHVGRELHLLPAGAGERLALPHHRAPGHAVSAAGAGDQA